MVGWLVGSEGVEMGMLAVFFLSFLWVLFDRVIGEILGAGRRR